MVIRRCKTTCYIVFQAYEWALRKAQQLDWSENSAKAFVVIGDDVPHHPVYTDQNVFWQDELDILIGMGVKVRKHDVTLTFTTRLLTFLLNCINMA